MTSILQTMLSVAQKEIDFNSDCREMAKDNVLLAHSYIKSALKGVFIHPVNDSTTSIALKGRCINLIKGPLLLLRSFILYLPLTNRATQLALRFLSPRQPIDFIKSSPFTPLDSELEIRYNGDTLITFKARKLLEKNIQENKECNPLMFSSKDLLDAYTKLSPPLTLQYINSSDFKEVKVRYGKDTRRKFIEDYFKEKIDQKEAFDPSNLGLFGKLGFNSEECLVIFTQLSDPLTLQYINSSDFKQDEAKARYSEDTRRKFIEDYFKEKIDQKEAFDPSNLGLFGKLGFNSEECLVIFTQLSDPLTLQYINSSDFKQDELKVRYSEDIRREFIKNYFKEKIDQKEAFDPKNLYLFSKLGFNPEECLAIFTQLSTSLSIDFINSSEFKQDELKVRYSKDACREFIEDSFKEKIRTKKEVTRLDLNLSNDEQTIFINKLNFTYQECCNIFLNFLGQPAITKNLSKNLRREVNQYKKNPLN